MIDQLFIAQLEKQYIPYLKNKVLGDSFQPIVLRGGKNKPETTAALHQLIKLFQDHEKHQHNKGWLIEWETWTSKKLGSQQWPSTIKVTTEEDFLYLIKKEKEIASFDKQLEQLLKWNPEIRSWLANKPKLVLELQIAWPGICSVVDHLLKYDVANHYIRSIPVPVHTKFIEQYKKIIHSILHHLNKERFPSSEADLEEALLLKKKPFLFPVRWLDENLSEQFTAGMQIFAVPVSYLKNQRWPVEKVILVENETNLYLLPSLPGTISICSYGKALHLLKEIGFLHHARLYYWGDMDEQGFNMLNDIRYYYNHAISLFMDDKTLSHHQAELDIRTIPYKKKELSLLQPHERSAYELLLVNNQWLEQERLQQAYVQEQLKKII
jgi:hypothetical protein